MSNISSILDQREKQHGDYGQSAAVSQNIKKATNYGLAKLSPVQRESLDLIATKIGRIICGDPNNADHWLDIEGYARLARNELEEQK